MPNYYSDDYKILQLFNDATYEDVIKNYEELIEESKSKGHPDLNYIDKLTKAKIRLANLLKPIEHDKLVLALDFDLNLTKKHTANTAEFDNCDDQTVINNIRNPDALKKLILLAISTGHRVAIVTFNEKCVNYKGKNIYLVRRFLYALFDEDIIGQILIIADDVHHLKRKKLHITSIQNKWHAESNQIILVDDDRVVLTNTSSNFDNEITTVIMPIYKNAFDSYHLIILSLLSDSLTQAISPKEIQPILKHTNRYFKICDLKEKNPTVVLELFKKYIIKYFDKFSACAKLIGLIKLIDNNTSYTPMFDVLLKIDSVQHALCIDPLITELLTSIIRSPNLPDFSIDNTWNKFTLIFVIINERQKYSLNHTSLTMINIPQTFLNELFKLTNSYIKELFYHRHWTVLALLNKLDYFSYQITTDTKDYPQNIENCYLFFPRFIKARTAEQIEVGKALLLAFQNIEKSYHQNQILDTRLLHYLYLEFSYGTTESFEKALFKYCDTLENKGVKLKILMETLTLQVLPFTCDKSFSLLSDWIELLLKHIDNKENILLNNNDLLLKAIPCDNVKVFNLIHELYGFSRIHISLLKATIAHGAYTLFLHLIPYLDLKTYNASIFIELLNNTQIKYKTLQQAWSLFKALNINVQEINLKSLLLYDIKQGNSDRVLEILTDTKFNINLEQLLEAIHHHKVYIFSMLLSNAHPAIITNSLLHYIAKYDFKFNPIFIFTHDENLRYKFLKMILNYGKILDLDNIDYESGLSLIHQLVLVRDFDSLQLLLSYGANPLVKNSTDETALQFAQNHYCFIDESTYQDKFDSDYKTILASNDSVQFICDINTNDEKIGDEQDKILKLLTTVEQKNIMCLSHCNEIDDIYNAVRNNQLTNFISLLTYSNTIKFYIADRKLSIGFDLLNIIVFNNQNPFMLQMICENGLAQQLCEPPIFNILSKLTALIITTNQTHHDISFHMFNILCNILFVMPKVNLILQDITLFRQMLQVILKDTCPINSKTQLINKLINTIGSDFLHDPLLIQNADENLRQYVLQLRFSYPLTTQTITAVSSEQRLVTAIAPSTTLPITTPSTFTIVHPYNPTLTDSQKLSKFTGPLNNSNRGTKNMRNANADIDYDSDTDERYILQSNK